MGFIDRLRTAALVLIGREKAIIGLPFGSDGGTTKEYSDTDFEKLSKDGYEHNAVIYACVNELASSASEAQLIVEQRTRDGWEERPDHPLKQLLDKPNPEMSGYEFLFQLTMYDGIAGNMFYEKERSKASRVVGLWPMWPQRVQILSTESKPRERVKRTVAGYKWISGGDSVQLPVDDVIHFKRPHPRKKVWGFPPLVAAAREGDTDNSATDFVNSFFTNAGIPFGMFKVEGFIDQPERERIEGAYMEMHSGKARWHKPLILGSGTEWISMADSFKDMDFPNLREITESRICMVYQVHPIIIGAYVGLKEQDTRAGSHEARKGFWLETLMPHYRRIQDCLNLYLAPEFGRDIRVRFDFSGVKALQEEASKLWERVNAAVEKGWLLVSEARSIAGLDEAEGTDVFLRPLMIQAVVPGQEAEPVEPTELPGAKELKSASWSDEAKELWYRRIDITARAWEPIFRRKARQLFQEEKDELVKILKKEGKASKQATPYQTFLDAGLTYLIVNKDGWRQAFLPLFTGLLGAQMENVLAAYGISWDIERPEVQQWIDSYTIKFTATIGNTSEAAIRSIVAQAQAGGWPVTKTREAIMDTWGGFSKERADMIARTETMRSSNYGTRQAWKDAGVERVSWYTHFDGRQCGWCEEMHGKIISVTETYASLGDEITYQTEDGSIKGLKVTYSDVESPPLHVFCRCIELAVVE